MQELAVLSDLESRKSLALYQPSQGSINKIRMVIEPEGKAGYGSRSTIILMFMLIMV